MVILRCFADFDHHQKIKYPETVVSNDTKDENSRSF